MMSCVLILDSLISLAMLLLNEMAITTLGKFWLHQHFRIISANFVKDYIKSANNFG